MKRMTLDTPIRAVATDAGTSDIAGTSASSGPSAAQPGVQGPQQPATATPARRVNLPRAGNRQNPTGPPTNLTGLPTEVVQQIAAHFSPGSGDAIRLSRANKKLRADLAGEVRADKTIHEIGAPRLYPIGQQELLQSLQDTADLPEQQRCQVMQEMARIVGRGDMTATPACAVLNALQARIAGLDTDAHKTALASALAVASGEQGFVLRLNVRNVGEAQPPRDSDAFFHAMLAIAQALPPQYGQQVSSRMSGNLHLIAAPAQRFAYWQQLHAFCQPGRPEDRAGALQGLAVSLRTIPDSAMRDDAVATVLRDVDNLPHALRAMVLRSLVGVIGTIDGADAQVALFRQIRAASDALPASHRIGMIDMRSQFNSFHWHPETVQTIFQANADAFRNLSGASLHAGLEMLASTLALAPQDRRAAVFTDIIGRLNALPEALHIKVLGTLLLAIDHLPDEAKSARFFELTGHLQQAPAQVRTAAVRDIIEKIYSLPRAIRAAGLNEMLRLSSLEPAAARAEQLGRMSNNARCLNHAEQTSFLFSSLMAARELPSEEYGQALMGMAKTCFTGMPLEHVPARARMLFFHAQSISAQTHAQVADALATPTIDLLMSIHSETAHMEPGAWGPIWQIAEKFTALKAMMSILPPEPTEGFVQNSYQHLIGRLKDGNPQLYRQVFPEDPA